MTVENDVKKKKNVYRIIKAVRILGPIKPNVHILPGDDKVKIKKKTSMCNLCDYSETIQRKARISTI